MYIVLINVVTGPCTAGAADFSPVEGTYDDFSIVFQLSWEEQVSVSS